MSYFFHPDAEAEHLESVAFYETRRAGLGASYLASFEAAMEHVAKAPLRIATGSKEARTFGALASSGFPFILFSAKRRMGYKCSQSPMTGDVLRTG